MSDPLSHEPGPLAAETLRWWKWVLLAAFTSLLALGLLAWSWLIIGVIRWARAG